MTYNTEAVRYAVIPYNAQDAPGCGDAVGFPNLSSILSHEIVEGATNPDAVGGGWYDQFGQEVADICNHQNAKLKGTDGFVYVVQRSGATSNTSARRRDRCVTHPWATPRSSRDRAVSGRWSSRSR